LELEVVAQVTQAQDLTLQEIMVETVVQAVVVEEEQIMEVLQAQVAMA
jgi:hypothetical protein